MSSNLILGKGAERGANGRTRLGKGRKRTEEGGCVGGDICVVTDQGTTMRIAFIKQMMTVSLLLLCRGAEVFAAGRPAKNAEYPLLPLDAGGSPAAESSAALPRDSADDAERVMKALAAAHPKRIGVAVLRDGDWAVQIRGEWFYYAGGRLLPEQLRTRAEEYDRLPFYPYPEELPAWQPPSAESAARFRDAGSSRQTRTSKRSTFFWDAVWNVRTREEAWNQVKTIRFLGKETLVHYAVLEELALIEQKIQAAAVSNAEVRTWISSIDLVSAWEWRNIADIQTRSNHAYGIAIDILPKASALRGLETYWLWTQQKKIDWWTVSYKGRYQPPDAVIKIFESYGFIWGGKWIFYDTMHFEYRPELIILSGRTLSGEY